MGVRDNVRVLKNTVKTPKSKEPDFRIIGYKLGECGAGWNKIGKTSGKPFISITLEPQTMNNMRSKGTGPSYYKHGRRVLYDVDELRTWSVHFKICLLYTSPSPRDATLSRMPSSA